MRIRDPQGDRDFLHATTDRRLPGPPHARTAGPGRRTRLPPSDAAGGGGASRAPLLVRSALNPPPSDPLDRVGAKEGPSASLPPRDALLWRGKRGAAVWGAAWFRGGATPPPAAFGAL